MRRDLHAESQRANEEWMLEHAGEIAANQAHAERERQLGFKAMRTLTEAKRRAAELQRVVAWADKDAIRAVYREARRLTEKTGIVHHVDHHYPLRGRLVSGLHVHQNLRILTGTENCRKSNRYEVE